MRNRPSPRRQISIWARSKRTGGTSAAWCGNTARPTEALLNSCKLITVRKGVLILGFATPVLQSKMNTPENLELTRNAIAHLLGIEVPITTVVTKGNSGELPPDLDVDADGMVSAALDLGGKIVKQD